MQYDYSMVVVPSWRWCACMPHNDALLVLPWSDMTERRIAKKTEKPPIIPASRKRKRRSEFMSGVENA